MGSGDKFYCVTGDKRTWSKEPLSIADLEERGYTVQDARLVGDKDLFHGGRLVAHLFASRADAARHLLA